MPVNTYPGDAASELGSLREWIGRREVRGEVLNPDQAIKLGAMLNSSGPLAAGDGCLAVPVHWLYHLPFAPTSAIGDDGHPNSGGLLPPLSRLRRMWASSRITAEGPPLKLNTFVRKESVITEIQSKRGISGDLLFIHIEHTLFSDSGPHLHELQQIVYRDAAPSASAPANVRVARRDEVWSQTITATPVLLFRYSALTLNSHRIHYDRSYAVSSEGYQGLVVQGPLIATLLLEFAYGIRPGLRAVKFSFKAIRALIEGQPFQLCAVPLSEKSGLSLWVRDHEGFVTTEACVEFNNVKS